MAAARRRRRRWEKNLAEKNFEEELGAVGEAAFKEEEEIEAAGEAAAVFVEEEGEIEMAGAVAAASKEEEEEVVGETGEVGAAAGAIANGILLNEILCLLITGRIFGHFTGRVHGLRCKLESF